MSISAKKDEIPTGRPACRERTWRRGQKLACKGGELTRFTELLWSKKVSSMCMLTIPIARAIFVEDAGHPPGNVDRRSLANPQLEGVTFSPFAGTPLPAASIP